MLFRSSSGAGGAGGKFGGGGGGADNTAAGSGGSGAVRILWGGEFFFPTPANVVDVATVSGTPSTTTSVITIKYSLADAVSGLRATGTGCPDALGGFTLVTSYSATPSAANGAAVTSSTMTCTYTASGTATPTGATPTSGGTKGVADRVDRSSTVPAGYQLIADPDRPTATLVRVEELKGSSTTVGSATKVGVRTDDASGNAGADRPAGPAVGVYLHTGAIPTDFKHIAVNIENDHLSISRRLLSDPEGHVACAACNIKMPKSALTTGVNLAN